MKIEGIEQAAEIFKEKIQLAHDSNSRSQDIFRAIQEFLADIGTKIPNNENNSVQQEILRSVEELKTRLENTNS